MGFVYRDNVKETASAIGTGSITLGGAPDTSFRTFGSVMANGDTTDITILSATAFECCPATYNSGVLTRGTPTDSSNGDATVNFGTDDVVVFMNIPGVKVRPIGAGERRELLTANRTYYVRTDGSDSNTGLANTSGAAFLTIQKAIDVIAATLDAGGYTITIQVADGTYIGNLTLKNVTGFASAGSLIIKGNAGTPANVVIQGQVSATGLSVVWRIQDCKIGGAGAAACLLVSASFVQFANVNFGTCTVAHVWVTGSGKIEAVGNYAISGGAGAHARTDGGGLIVISGRTCTLSGTPAFSNGFVLLNVGPGICQCHVMTFSGSATGPRYYVADNSVCYVGGAGTSYLPGNAAGSTASGGQYV